MSSIKMTRLFQNAGRPSFHLCAPGSAIETALGEQGLDHVALAAGRYLAPRASYAIRRIVRRRNVRAIFLHALKDLWTVAPALVGLPEVRLYGFARMFVRGVNKKDFLHGRLYSRLDQLIALSHPQRAELLKCLPIRPDRVTVIPNGVDTERFQPRARAETLRAEWGVTPGQTLFGLVGRFDEQKGSLEFVDAAALVLRDHPGARFVMIGENTHGEDDYDQRVRARVSELGLGEKVILTAFRRDVPAVMNALDVFVMPSYEENFGNVLLEAMSSGLATIGTDSGGTPEILSGGAVGLLCQPRSAVDLARAAARLMAEPDLIKDLGQRARAKALAEYDMDVVFRRILALTGA